MHLIDLMWGILSVAGAAVPAYRLYDNLHRPGAFYLLGLVVVCAVYPWAYIVYPHTFFDQGLVFLLTSWIGPLYLLAVCTYLTIQPVGWIWIRSGVLLAAACLALLAVTNPLHGQFATFAEVTTAKPLSTTGQIAHGPGMTTMGGLSIACIVLSVLAVGFQFTRSRFHLSHLLTITFFPVAAGLAYLLPNNAFPFLPEAVNPVIFSTTIGLAAFTCSLLWSQFLEVRPIARELVLNLLPDAMAVVSSSGIVLDCNTQFAHLLDREVRTTVGNSLTDHLPASAWTLVGTLEATKKLELEVNDSLRIFEVHLASVDLRGKHGEVLMLLRDTTEQTLAHQQLKESQAELHALNIELARLSNTDALTGLRNRRYFLDQLGQEYERSARLDQSFAMLSIDLDDFKSINDNYGHATGDQALISAARAMEQQCRAVDTLARVGGEEFMVILLGINDAELERVAERFRKAIAETLVRPSDNSEFGLTASIGAAHIRPNTDIQTALHQIDEALYTAKRAGRNRVVIKELLLTETA